MIRKSISNKASLASALATLAIICVLYGIMCYRQKAFNPNDTTIPNIPQFVDGVKFAVMPSSTGDILLWHDLKATYLRHFLGIGVGVLISLLFGLAMGCYSIVEAAFRLPIAFLAKIPPT